MTQPMLAFDRAPAIDIPLRFLLAAPLLALPVGVLLLYRGPALLASRWSGATLAATHLITVGFVAHSIVGALLQYLPVAGNVDLRWPHRLAPWLQRVLTAGTLLLAAGFLFQWESAMQIAAWMLATTLALFALPTLLALLPAAPTESSLRAVSLGLVALGVTITLGLTLAVQQTSAGIRDIGGLTNLHAAWGIIGWVATTIIGVALSVVPMFQLTPRYPEVVASALPLVLTGLLLLLSFGVANSSELAREVSAILIALGVAVFGVATWRLQRASRRREDVTVWLWRFAAGCAMGAALCMVLAVVYPVETERLRPAMLLGILLLPGFAMSVINGMMYKIVPFLVWLHLQQAGKKPRSLQHMRQIISESAMRRQAGAHVGSVLALIAALWWESAVYVAGVLWGASQLTLALNLLRARARYGQFMRAS